MLENISFGQNRRYKKCTLFFRKLQLIRVLLLIHDSYMSLIARFVSPKFFVRFSIFDSISFLFFKKEAWAL